MCYWLNNENAGVSLLEGPFECKDQGSHISWKTLKNLEK